MLIRCVSIVVILLALVVPTVSSAGVIVTVQDANIVANGSGFVDILISSSAPNELLSSVNFEFAIVGSPSPTGSLEFLPTTDFGPPGYVFGPATGNYFETIASPTSLTGGDSYQTGDVNVTLTGTPANLVRLNLKHNTGTPLAAVGSTFQLDLVSSLLTDFQFWDDMGTPGDLSDDGPTSLPIDLLLSDTSGTITIISGAAAVPEPGTFAVLAIAGVGFVGQRLRKKKTVKLLLESDATNSEL